MAKYNAAKHRIESDDGRILATLTEHVETSKAWEVADWWGGDYDEIEELHAEITNKDFNLEKVKESEDYERRELDKVSDELGDAEIRIDDLEAEIEKIKAELAQKGAQAA
jgi:chromosome segregation ATPase